MLVYIYDIVIIVISLSPWYKFYDDLHCLCLCVVWQKP